MKLKTNLEQTLGLSQQQLQSSKILRMGSNQLLDYLKDFVMGNPAADMGVLDHNFELIDVSASPSQIGNNICSLNHSDAQSLTELLLDQLPPALSQAEEKALVFMISCLDDRGYFTEDIDALTDGVPYSAYELQQALGIIKTMEPAGVGASDIQECLLLQLERMGGGFELEAFIAKNHLDDLASGRLKKIASSAKKPLSNVQAAARNIKKLNPIPANGLNCREKPSYIRPEVYIYQADGRLSLRSGFLNACDVEISEGYSELIETSVDEEARAYMQNHLRELQELKYSLKQRKRTIIRITEEIVRIQADFFLGKSNYLKSISLKDMAELLELSVSTISRAIQDKYLVCSKGTFPYKYFFQRKIPAASKKQAVSSSSILQERIKELIAAEDRENPLSDQQLSELLECRGIKVARRTVAKYREKLGIPGIYLRKAERSE